MNLCAVVALTIALVHPCVFSAPRVCPRCLDCEAIEIASEDAPAWEPTFVDACGQPHYHLEYLRYTLYRCGSVEHGTIVNGCGNVWVEQIPAPACPCGWSADHRVWVDPCAQTSSTHTEVPLHAQ